jgi:hypothetical protein
MRGGEPSSQARGLAESALAWLLDELKDEDLFIVVLGGLVPEVLTRGQEPPVTPNLGTADVDVLLATHVHADRDYGPVEAALDRMGFAATGEAWRWRGRVGDRPVVIEFLCDLDTAREGEEIHPLGCRTLAAANLRGTGFVARDYAWEEITARVSDGRTVTVRARFAGLEGYLLSKAVATRTRAADKDYYDFAYVLLYNRAGAARLRRARGSGTVAFAKSCLAWL